MNMKQITVAIALGFIMVGAVHSVEARQQQGQAELSGTFINTDFDVNGDGAKAGHNNVYFKGPLGLSSGHSVLEFEFNAAADCPPEHFGFTVVSQDADGNPVVWKAVNRFGNTGDLIILEYMAGTICFDPVTTIQAFTVELDIMGGTGKYEGATGTQSCEGTAIQFVGDGAATFFGEQHGTCEFTINLDPGADESCSLALLGIPCP